MSNIKRYLNGSPGIFKVVGLIISKTSNGKCLPLIVKMSNFEPLKISPLLATLPNLFWEFPKKIKRYIKGAPSNYKVMGYHFLKPNYGQNKEFKSNLQLSVNEKPLSFHAILREMVKVAI